MKRYFLFSSILLTGALALTLQSCKKEEPDTETTSATDNAICEAEFSRIMPDVNGIAVNEEGIQRLLPGVASACYTLSWSGDTAMSIPGVTGHMYIDFGTNSTCASADGKIRSGMIEVIFDQAWRAVGSSDTIKLINFKVKNNSTHGGIQYDGKIVIAWQDSVTYNYQVIGGKCTKGSEWTVLWDCNRTMKWVGGAGDSIPGNDVFHMWGSANGTNRESRDFTVDVPSGTPLVRTAGCRYITSGELTITPDGKNARTVDFGDGTCDDRATLIINGNAFEFTLN
ncbi:MAG: hypothetical protein AB1458_05590 [Bacteroidota bacterium]